MAEIHDQRNPLLGHFDVEESIVFVKMLRVHLEKYAPYMGGGHIFQKNHDKNGGLDR